MADDDRPIERSAKSRPPPAHRVAAAAAGAPRRKSVDPRFDPLYGSLNKNTVKHSYAFLAEMEKAEFGEHLQRMKVLREASRRAAKREADGDSGSENAEDDDAEDRDEEFEAAVSAATATMRPQRLERALAEEQRFVAHFRQKEKQSQATDREQEVRKRYMKAQAQDVLEHRKARPFFLKSSEMKKEVERARFDALEKKGGQDLVDKFIDRKRKREVGGTREPRV